MIYDTRLLVAQGHTNVSQHFDFLKELYDINFHGYLVRESGIIDIVKSLRRKDIDYRYVCLR